MSNFNLGSLFNFNKVSSYFQKNREKDTATQIQLAKNSVGAAAEEIQGTFFDYNNVTPGQTVNYLGQNFDQMFSNKAGRISKYREMSLYPRISNALDIVCDDTIVGGANSDVCSLNIKREVPQHIEEKLRAEWDYLIHDVFGVNERAWDLFRKWLTESELYVELIIADSGDKIIGIKVLPAHTMLPIYQNNQISAFMQTKRAYKAMGDVGSVGNEEETVVMFDVAQVVYSNYGVTGDNLLDIRGYLEPVIRVYNQLKNIEDSLIIYRMNRSPLRRVFNVQTPGNMPPNKAMEFLRNMVKQYRKKVTYNAETGETDTAANITTMLEDFWFIKNQDGSGTTVDTMGENTGFLGEIDDVKYFVRLINEGLKIPQARWEDAGNAGYTSGKSGEITRDEIRFAKFIERLQRRFKFIFLDAFITHLRLTGIDDEYVDINLFDLDFSKANLHKEYRQLELIGSKMDLLTTLKDNIYTAENETGWFSREFCLRNFLCMSDADLEMNKEMLEKEKLEAKGEAPKKTTETPEEQGATTETPPEEEVAKESPEVPTSAEDSIAQTLSQEPQESTTFKGSILNEWKEMFKEN
jgi:hypothetical protein